MGMRTVPALYLEKSGCALGQKEWGDPWVKVSPHILEFCPGQQVMSVLEGI